MGRRSAIGFALFLFALGVAVRANNAIRFPVLAGYDAFGHFTYIWYLSETGRVPLATSGWSFFHPPLYYWLMSEIWQGLPGADPVVRLKIGTLLMSLLGTTHAVVAYVLTRRVLPENPFMWIAAGALTLFVPVNIYGAAFLGSEGLSGVLCAIALLATVRLLEKRTWQRALVLGVVLGAAMLTKFTALALAVSAVVTIALKAIRERELRWGLQTTMITGTVMIVVCGWYYQRNVILYGTPFKLSRDDFIVSHVEDSQPRTSREWIDYLIFDPLIFVRPVWPRGFSASEDTETEPLPARVRGSVWTGLYANTWFDGFGGWVLPTVTDSNLSRRCGQLLLTLGTVPTILVLAGFFAACRRIVTRGWDDTIVPAVIAFSSMVALYVISTRTVPIPAAVKATYFMPVAACFGLWFAMGLNSLLQRWPKIGRAALAASVALATLSVAVFWQGFLFDTTKIQHHIPLHDATRTNSYGVVYYAAGNTAEAKRLFEKAADLGWYVAHENLALLALRDGQAEVAARELQTAEALLREPGQTFGQPADRARFIRETQAEYRNLEAITEFALGNRNNAIELAERSLELDEEIAETHFNMGVFSLAAAVSSSDANDRASQQFARALELDEAFVEASEMLAVTRAMSGDCAGARAKFEDIENLRGVLQRSYPIETGPGLEFAASIGRRQTVTPLPPPIAPATWRERCAHQLSDS